MSLISLMLFLLAAGAFLWLIGLFVTIDGRILSLIHGVLAVFVVVVLLQNFGVLPPHKFWLR